MLPSQFSLLHGSTLDDSFSSDEEAVSFMQTLSLTPSYPSYTSSFPNPSSPQAVGSLTTDPAFQVCARDKVPHSPDTSALPLSASLQDTTTSFSSYAGVQDPAQHQSTVDAAGPDRESSSAISTATMSLDQPPSALPALSDSLRWSHATCSSLESYESDALATPLPRLPSNDIAHDIHLHQLDQHLGRLGGTSQGFGLMNMMPTRRPAPPPRKSSLGTSGASVGTGIPDSSAPASIVCTSSEEDCGSHTVWKSSVASHTPRAGTFLPGMTPRLKKQTEIQPPSPTDASSIISHEPRSSYDPSVHSSPEDSPEGSQESVSSRQDSSGSVRITGQVNGPPRLSFIEGVSHLGGLHRNAPTPSGDSQLTVTESSSGTGRRLLVGSSTHSFASSSSRGKAAFMTLCNRLKTVAARGSGERQVEQQRDSLTEELITDSECSSTYLMVGQGSGKHDRLEDAPRLGRLSLGGSISMEDLSGPRRSTEGHPVTPPGGDWVRRSRKFSRSMVCVVENRELNASNPPYWPERPRTPEHTQRSDHVSRANRPNRPISPPLSDAAPPHRLLPLQMVERPTSSVGSFASLTSKQKQVRKRPSFVRGGARSPQRAPPLPPRQRRESFGVKHSGFSKSHRPPSPLPADSPSTWREYLQGNGVYESTLALPDGALEVKRQEVLWELTETESIFVRSCRSVLRLFVAPLKVATDGWLSGVPPKVCTLFEELENITTVHNELLCILEEQRRDFELVDLHRFADIFKAWVSTKLDCYEKYLQLFEGVVQYLEEMTWDDQSELGEFFRMQLPNEAMGSMTLSSMLLKPVQRFTKYPLFIKRLLDATPVSHHAHQNLIDLLDTTQATIQALQDAKAREDDLRQLVALQECLDGIPSWVCLAQPGRRLIGHTQIQRVSRESRFSLNRSGSTRSLKGSGPPTPPRKNSDASLTSSAEAHVQGSLSPEPAAWYSSAPPTVRVSSHSRSPPMRSSSSNANTGLSRRPSWTSSGAESSAPPTVFSTLSIRRNGRRDDALTLLIFNDLVLVAAPQERNLFKYKPHKGEPTRFRVLAEEDGGAGVVQEAREIPGWGGFARVLSLSLVRPGGLASNSTYALVPLATLPRKAQRTAALASPGIDNLGAVLGALTTAAGRPYPNAGKQPNGTEHSA